MIKRIVKMTFDPDRVDDFVRIFEEKKQYIRNFEGCQHLELWRATQAGNIFFTYSFWENEAALERYRHSDLFRTTWVKTKALFADKPEAWSVNLASETKAE